MIKITFPFSEELLDELFAEFDWERRTPVCPTLKRPVTAPVTRPSRADRGGSIKMPHITAAIAIR